MRSRNAQPEKKYLITRNFGLHFAMVRKKRCEKKFGERHCEGARTVRKIHWRRANYTRARIMPLDEELQLGSYAHPHRSHAASRPVEYALALRLFLQPYGWRANAGRASARRTLYSTSECTIPGLPSSRAISA